MQNICKMIWKLIAINKPMTLIPQIIVPLLLIIFNLIYPMNGFFIPPSIAALVIFYFWYFGFLVERYLLNSDEPIKIINVDISIFKKPTLFVFTIFIITGIPASVANYYYFASREFDSWISTASSYALLLYLSILFKILTKYIEAKFISESLKQNANLKVIRLDNFYSEVRNLLVKKIIK